MNNIEIYQRFKQKAMAIVQDLRGKPESKYFMNSQYINDPKFIRSTPHPTSLSYIFEKIQQDGYRNPDEFKNDVNQLFSSAKIFHSDPDNVIHKAANSLQLFFNIEASKLPHILEVDELNCVTQRYIELRILKYRLSKSTHI
ncbi:hypothetical protein M9Y10_008359 [Tritrichomonas musculus]|uniref:Bromo domain-containing protein n=1 Tax=Tritrichomonas musculus TaxID=1915356 RepID=A0ABR2IYU6_9EUKA